MSDHFLHIADEPPDDASGRISRGGYTYQDLCALRYCIRIMEDPCWSEVWCESHDDIVLYSTSESGDRYRFLQVKFRFNAGQHWSCAALCSPPTKKTLGESIICKLFGKDRFAGSCDFRLVTNEGVSDRLRSFFYRWTSSEPLVDLSCAGARDLIQHLEKWTPPNGRKIEDYLRRFAIEVHAADIPDMEAGLLRELARCLQRQEIKLLPDELDLLFDHLYRKVSVAADRALSTPGHPERVIGKAFRQAALEKAQLIMAGTNEVSESRASELLRAQLGAIGVPKVVIDNANDLRWKYWSTWRRNSGTELGRLLDSTLDDVRAIYVEESLKVMGDPSLSGRILLQAVLDRARDLHARSELGAYGISLGIVHGMIYFLVGRQRLELA